jgi:hypothetical protein
MADACVLPHNQAHHHPLLLTCTVTPPPTAVPACGRLACTTSSAVTRLSALTTTGSVASLTHTLRDTALAVMRYVPGPCSAARRTPRHVARPAHGGSQVVCVLVGVARQAAECGGTSGGTYVRSSGRACKSGWAGRLGAAVA